jgi:hypothetical protein
MEWQYPPRLKVIAEYWLQHPAPSMVIVTEADSFAPIMAATAPWRDVHDFVLVPAVTADEGIPLAKRRATLPAGQRTPQHFSAGGPTISWGRTCRRGLPAQLGSGTPVARRTDSRGQVSGPATNTENGPMNDGGSAPQPDTEASRRHAMGTCRLLWPGVARRQQ